MSTIELADPEGVGVSLASRAGIQLLLDYDGTLVPFAARPALARPDAELLELLRRLAERPQTRVSIVSGRDPDTLATWFAGLPLDLWAEHGAWARRRNGAAWAARAGLGQPELERVATRVLRVTNELGGRFERKRAGAAWHYRGLDIAPRIIDEIREDLARDVRVLGFEVLPGACVLDVRLRGVNKGTAVLDARAREPGASIVVLGDDTTDEDMFRRLRERDLGVLVGTTHRASAAHLRLWDFEAARTLLRVIAESPPPSLRSDLAELTDASEHS